MDTIQRFIITATLDALRAILAPLIQALRQRDDLTAEEQGRLLLLLRLDTVLGSLALRLCARQGDELRGEGVTVTVRMQEGAV